MRAALDSLASPPLELAVALNMLTAIDTREFPPPDPRAEWYGRVNRRVSRVVEITEATLGPTHPDFVRTLGRAAQIYSGRDLEKATATRERLLGLLSQTLGASHPKVAVNRLLWQDNPPSGDPQTARQSLADQLMKFQATSGDQPEIASALVDLSESMSEEEGLPLVQRALAIRRAAPRQPYLADIHTLGVFIQPAKKNPPIRINRCGVIQILLE